MNVTGNSNAKKGPHKSFNAYKEFSDIDLDAQVTVCAMTHFGMSNIDGRYNFQKL